MRVNIHRSTSCVCMPTGISRDIYLFPVSTIGSNSFCNELPRSERLFACSSIMLAWECVLHTWMPPGTFLDILCILCMCTSLGAGFFAGKRWIKIQILLACDYRGLCAIVWMPPGTFLDTYMHAIHKCVIGEGFFAGKYWIEIQVLLVCGYRELCATVYKAQKGTGMYGTIWVCAACMTVCLFLLGSTTKLRNKRLLCISPHTHKWALACVFFAWKYWIRAVWCVCVCACVCACVRACVCVCMCVRVCVCVCVWMYTDYAKVPGTFPYKNACLSMCRFQYSKKEWCLTIRKQL